MSSTAIPPEHFPAENGVHVWRTAIAVPPITAIFVALRLYSRLHILRRRLAVDDYVVLVTMCILIAHATLMALATYHGMGLHVWQYTPELNTEYYFWLALSSVFYTSSLFGFKTALLLLYLQIFGANRKFRIACYITLGLTWAYLTPAILTEFLGCWPPAKKWSPEIDGHCMYDVPAKIFYGAGHAVSDLVILTLPLAIIWRLKFSTLLQKIGLSFILCSGFIAMAVGVARWAITVYNMLSYDRPWWAGVSFTLSILEPNLGLICACVATFSPLAQLSYAKSKNWTIPRQNLPIAENNPGLDSFKPHDTVTTVHNNDGPVLGATAYPSHPSILTPYPSDLHGLQALDEGGARTDNHPVRYENPSQPHTYQLLDTASPKYPHDPGDIGRNHGHQVTTQNVDCRGPAPYTINPGHVTGYNQDKTIPEQFPAGSSYPAYYTEFPSDLGQENVNNPIYYDASWSPRSRSDHEETCTAWQYYRPD